MHTIKKAKTFGKSGLMWLIVLLLSAMSTHAAQADELPDLNIELVENISPNPAVVNEGTTTKFRAHLYKKGTKDEIFPPGTSVNWSCVWTKKDQEAQVANPTNVSFNPSSTGHNDITTMSASFAAVGSYEIRVNVRASNDAWPAPKYVEVRTSVSLTVKDVVVTFSPATLRTGYWTDKKEKDIVNDVTATVRPASATSQVTVAVKTGKDTDNMDLDNNVSISDVVPDTAGGKIAFKLRGTGASTAKKPDGSYKKGGNTLVEGQVGGVSKGSMRIVVVVPASIKKPYPNYHGAVTGINVALNQKTTPSDYSVPAPARSLVTSYTVDLKVAVLDQFGDALDDLYAGAAVQERFPDLPPPADSTSLRPINQKLATDGSYTDPSGRFYPGTPPHYYVADDRTPEDQKEIADWIAGKFGKSLLRTETDPLTIDVFVAGHLLSPSTVRSHNSTAATPTTPGTLIIEWRDK